MSAKGLPFALPARTESGERVLKHRALFDFDDYTRCIAEHLAGGGSIARTLEKLIDECEGRYGRRPDMPGLDLMLACTELEE